MSLTYHAHDPADFHACQTHEIQHEMSLIYHAHDPADFHACQTQNSA